MKFIKGKTYYCGLLKDKAFNFSSNVFTVLYKSGMEITIADTYNKDNKIKCLLESNPNIEIIKLPNNEMIWRNLCQEKLINGKFEEINLPTYECYEF